MKKFIYLAIILIMLLSLCACRSSVTDDASLPQSNTLSSPTPNSTKQDNDVINITEKMYVTYINEIYTNTKDYIGKTIKIEGMFTSENSEQTGKTYHYVYRTGPGCCGNDGSMCGFEFTFNGNMPKKNDWICVEGILGTYEENGNNYLSLNAKSVTVLETRGAETVYQ